jgi:ADP-dependent NAD(P)H-hydrate dehydratase / NAD(P)H-hydrate epimerase
MSELFNCASVRAIEQLALASLPEGTLMSRAAIAVANQAERMLRRCALAQGNANTGHANTGHILILAGPGNNGADALLSGLLLNQRGFRVCALVRDEAKAEPPKPEASTANAPMAGSRSPSPLNSLILEDYTARQLPIATYASRATFLSGSLLIIDGLLGIGQSRPLADELLALVADVNRQDVPVLSVDVPTGLNADTGAVLGGVTGICLRAHTTVTMLCDKPGLHTGAGRELAGAVIVASLGCASPRSADAELFDHSLANKLLPRRATNSHKGSFGSVLIMGGAHGMQGAAILAATGAQAGGAGKVFISSPDHPIWVAEQAQWMTRAWLPSFDDIDAIALGCGLGNSDAALHALDACWNSAVALVLDADALNGLAFESGNASRPARPAITVMTPHPLEAARLLNCSTADIQNDRCASALKIAKKFSSVVILKGAGSIVASAQGQCAIINSGAPTLAVAGTGDVLSGVLAALLAQGLSAWDAARLAAFSHGRAGEWMHERLPLGSGLAAGELFDPIRQILNGTSAAPIIA